MKNRLKKVFYALAFLIILNLTVIYVQSCQQDFVTPPGDNIVQFPPEIEAIFNTPYGSNSLTCTTPSCHASENSQNGFDLTNWQKTLKGSNSGTMVIPYNAFWSHLISYVNSDTNISPVTPLTLLVEEHKIDSPKVATLMNWIDNGAKSKNGDVAYTNISNSEKGFITNQAADVVAVIQTTDRLVTRLIPVGGRSTILDAPHYVTVDPSKAYFYVSLIQEGYVEKYDVNSYAQVGRMAAGQSPAHILISPDGTAGYVTNFESSGTVRTTTKFNTDTMTVTDIFTDVAMTGPHGMALTRDGNTLYVASEIGEYIFKISTSTFYASDSTYIKSPIDPSVPPSGNGTGNFKPYQILLSPDESLLYVSCRGSNEVRIYNASDLIQVNSIALGANSYPLLMKFTNDGNYLFVCNRNNNTVSIINTSNNNVQTITGVGIQPHGVDFTLDGQYAIIACETQSGFDGHHPQIGSKKVGVSRLIQIQGSNFTLLPNKLEMGSFPAGIEILK